jgi:hypothetical protein
VDLDDNFMFGFVWSNGVFSVFVEMRGEIMCENPK